MITLDSSSVSAALVRAGLFHALPGGRLFDRAYTPPRSDWLLGDFDRWLRLCLPQLGLGAYVAEGADCDDYADLYATLARVCHRGMPGAPRSALPIGALHYHAERLGPHAIVCALTSDAGVIYIEPQQPAKRLTLSAREAASAWLLTL